MEVQELDGLQPTYLTLAEPAILHLKCLESLQTCESREMASIDLEFLADLCSDVKIVTDVGLRCTGGAT